jgi:hypothetical protein
VLDSNVAYLTKPFSKDWLVSKVQETLAGKSQTGPGM